MFESRISAAATVKLPRWEKRHAKTVAWSHDTEGHARNALNDTSSWQTRKWSSYIEFQVLAWMIINSRPEELESVGELSQVCSQIVLNACTWPELEDQTFCGRSTNLQAQSQNGLRHATDVWQD